MNVFGRRILSTPRVLARFSSTNTVVPPHPPASTTPTFATETAVSDYPQAPNHPGLWSENQRPRPTPATGPRFEQTAMHLQPQPLSAMDMIAKEPIRLSKTRIAACDGGAYRNETVFTSHSSAPRHRIAPRSLKNISHPSEPMKYKTDGLVSVLGQVADHWVTPKSSSTSWVSTFPTILAHFFLTPGLFTPLLLKKLTGPARRSLLHVSTSNSSFRHLGPRLSDPAQYRSTGILFRLQILVSPPYCLLGF